MPSRYSSSRARTSDARVLAENLGVELLEIPIAPAMEVYDELLAPSIRGPRAGHHRGEPAGADPRQPADGAVEQVRLARADDRQQVGELGRLLDAVRRLGRRLRGDQGRAEDARLPARRLPQRRGDGAHPVPRSIIDRPPSAELRADQRDADSLPGLRHARRDPRGLRRGGPRPRAARARRAAGGGDRARGSRWSTAPSTSAARRRPGSRSRRARSGATGGCRSRTPTGRGAGRRSSSNGPRSSSARGRTGGPRRR